MPTSTGSSSRPGNFTPVSLKIEDRMKADIDSFVTLHNIVKAAREKLDDNIWDYLIGGADTETTLKRNRQALDSVAFVLENDHSLSHSHS